MTDQRQTKLAPLTDLDGWRVAGNIANPEFLAANTVIAYQKAWNALCAWALASGISDPYGLSADHVCQFIRHAYGERRLAPATIRLYVSGIAWQYKQTGIASPTAAAAVKNTIGMIGRRAKARRRARPLLAEMLVDILALAPESVIGVRDAAILALGFAAALRRSEIAALEVRDISIMGATMMVRVRRSKTDQAGRGYDIPVIEGSRIRPISRVRRWIGAVGLEDPHAPLFMSMNCGGSLPARGIHPDNVNRIVKIWVERIGFDPSCYSAHSLRAGFVTSAARHGALVHKIMHVTRHTSTAMVMEYVRDADKFSEHAGASFM